MARQLHDRVMALVTDNSAISEVFAVTYRGKQGCVLAPTLFRLMFSAMLMDAYRDEHPGIRIAHRTGGHLHSCKSMQAPEQPSMITVYDLLFADDCALNTTIKVDMQRYMELLVASCLRRMLKLRWQDRIPDVEVLGRTDILSIRAMLKQLQLRWSDHLVRMEDTQLLKQLFYGDVVTGDRQPRGLKRPYTATLEGSLKRLKINPETWEDLAENRLVWKRNEKTDAGIYKANWVVPGKARRKARKSQVPRLLSSNHPPLPSCPAANAHSAHKSVLLDTFRPNAPSA
ncbi:hypothetical protein SprV_0200848000 [Sparganum proliferum]